MICFLKNLNDLVVLSRIPILWGFLVFSGNSMFSRCIMIISSKAKVMIGEAKRNQKGGHNPTLARRRAPSVGHLLGCIITPP
ncbi:MAG: hypothetical protein [Circular genetic element sp.]|nr:MAG: hypothetical protein [Circular genetic element sp.]